MQDKHPIAFESRKLLERERSKRYTVQLEREKRYTVQLERERSATRCKRKK